MRGQSTIGWSGALVALLFAACGPDRSVVTKGSDHRLFSFRLEVTEIFGWTEQEGDQLLPLLADSVRNAGGGLIARPLNVVEGPDSTVFVLDGDYQKIAVFEWDGRYSRSVLGGYGEGPGEFVCPASMDLTKDGGIVVLDDNGNRVSIFDSSGDFVDSFNHEIANDIELVVSGDLIYLSRRLAESPSRPPVVALNFGGERVDSMGASSWQDGDLSMYGEPGALGKMSDGRPVYSPPAPATFVLPNRDEPLGMNRYKHAHGFLLTRPEGRSIRVAPTGVRGVAQLPDGRLAVLYQEYSTDAGSFLYFFDVFNAGGDYLGSAEIPNGHLFGRMTASKVGPYFYFTSHQGTMGGVRARLVEGVGE